MAPRFLDALQQRVLLADGAMGTQLQLAGLPPGACGELWNLDFPDKVLAIQTAYVDAGSNCLITNTFEASALSLGRYGLAGRMRDINCAGASIARRAFGTSEGYVLGDIGPFGGLMEPYGDVPEASVRGAYLEQARALVSAGVDAIIIETQTGLEELRIAIAAAREAGAPAVIPSVAYDVLAGREDVRTPMGISPEQAADVAVEAGADLIALNCGRGVDMAWAARITRRYRAACALPVMAQPNGGTPEVKDGRIYYRQTPEQMARDLPLLLEAGARVIGACCGSTPAHIAALAPIIHEYNASDANAYRG